MKYATVPDKHLLLIGGGHSHVEVLRRLMMRPADAAGIRVSLVAREVHTPYSGMLPGHVAGMYGFDDMHIDLARLCQAAGVRLVIDEIERLDLKNQQVTGKRGPPLGFDVLSLNTGACPGFDGVAVTSAVTPVKPIGQFLVAWRRIRAAIAESLASGRRTSLAVVGAGAGGVELALAVSRVFRGCNRKLLEISLIERDAEILPGHNSLVRRWLRQRLQAYGISILNKIQVDQVQPDGLVDAQGHVIPADHILWTTGVCAPAFVRESGLTVDSGGFVSVNRFLQSPSHPNLFAAGDIAHLLGQARPKSGVYAVRAGPVLSENLIRFCAGRRLEPYRAQRRALAIIGDYQGSAVASRGWLFASGAPLFHLKQWIDRRFMRMFVPEPMPGAADSADFDAPMRCAGCGSKLPANLLRRVLGRLDVLMHDEVLHGIGEDAALIDGVAPRLAVSTDHFAQMVGDTYLFGRIAAHHGMSDLYAMGAVPRYGLVNVSVRLMAPALMEEETWLLLKGVNDVFAGHGVSLIGGHSTESDATQLGCTLLGDMQADPLTKSGLVPGDCLILTKPLGIGVILAGDMRAETRGRWLQAALQVMDQSNAEAVRLLRESGARSCTDVTGFGLLGHLSEMLIASECAAEVVLSAVPLLAGAPELVEFGIESSLQPGNEAALERLELVGIRPSDARFRLLMDPQTSGGLIIGVRAQAADALVAALRAAGYERATVIGSVSAGGGSAGETGAIRVVAEL